MTTHIASQNKNEITMKNKQQTIDFLDPSFIEEIANQLYNETPGAVSIPKSEPDAHQAANSTGYKAVALVPTGLESDVTELAHQPDTQKPAGGDMVSGASTPKLGHSDYYFMSREESPESIPTFANIASWDTILPALNLDSLLENRSSPSVSEQYSPEQPGLYFLPPPQASRMGLDVYKVRQDFPILHQQVHGKPLIWFDNAATTQKPQSVIDTLSHFYEYDNSNIHRGAHTLAARATDAYEDARAKVQRFLKAGSAAEIIFVRGTTEGINLVAQSYGRKYIRAGDEIVLSVLEHHANIVPWQMLAQETGAVLRVVPINDRGEIILDEYAKLLGSRTELVALSHVSNALGTMLPIQTMTEMAHHHGAKVLIDGAQAVSHTPVNVKMLDCDFYVFSGHKIFGPTGIGAVYGKKALLHAMPPWQGGGSMIRTVTFEKTTYSDVPAKFEAGTPNIADAVGLGAAIDYVNHIGIENIAQYEHDLTGYATELLAQVPGLRQIGTAPNKVGVLSFVLQGMPSQEVGRLLDREGIAVRAGHHCAQPALQHFGLTETVRPSLAFYNTSEEVDALITALHKIQKSAQS